MTEHKIELTVVQVPKHGPETAEEIKHLAGQVDALFLEQRKLLDSLEILADRIDAAVSGFLENGQYILTYSAISNELRVIIAANSESERP